MQTLRISIVAVLALAALAAGAPLFSAPSARPAHSADALAAVHTDQKRAAEPGPAARPRV